MLFVWKVHSGNREGERSMTGHSRIPPLLGLLALLALPLPTRAAPPQIEDRETRVDELMADHGEDGPGAVVAVVEGGEIVFAKAYGLANLEHKVPMTRETVLDIGSTAKQFTAFAIVLLSQEGKLSLDDDIRSHLPEVPDFGYTITIRHLVHHMSGLREIYNALMMEGWQAGDGIAQEDALQLTARMNELNFEPGTEYLYCNTAYMLLADIVSRVSGVPFPEFMAGNVFGPVGMKNTTIMASFGQSIPGAAESYGPAEGGGFVRIFDNSTIQGAGGIYTTVDDLAAWMSNYADARVGGPEVIEQMQQRGVLASGDTLGYAFGLTIGESRGLRTLGHGGSSAGYRSSFTYSPEVDGGVIVLSNFAGFDGSIPGQVAEIFFGDRMEPVEGPEPTEAAAEGPVEVEVAEEVLEAYVGEYQLAPTFILSVTREGTDLFVQATGQGRNRVTASSDSTFYFRDVASFTFHRDADGSVPNLTLHQNGDHVANRRQPYTPSAERLTRLVGRYYSTELQTVYTLVVEEGKLMGKHRRHDDFELTATEEWVYGGPNFFAEVRFERDEAGGVTGMRVSNGRVRNLLFEKLSS